MSYADDHTSALADLTEDGAAVAFVKTTPGTHNAATDTVGTSTSATVAGYAIQVASLSASDRRAYDAAGLMPHEAPMLLFAASTYGEVPALGSAATWNGKSYIVRAFGDVVAPDGVAILSRPVLGA